MNRPLTPRAQNYRLVDSSHMVFVIAIAILFISGCGGGRQSNPILADYNRALKLADAELRAKELVQVARKQADAGDSMGAENTLSKAASSAEQVADAKGRAESLNAVAAAYGKLDRAFEANKLIPKIEESSAKVEDLEARVAILARLGLTQGLYLKDQAAGHATLAEAESEVGNIERPAGRVEGIMTIALAYYGMESTDESERVITEAIEAARAVADPREQANSLMSIGGKLNRIKQAKRSKELLAEAKSAADGIDDPLSRAYAYADLGREFNSVGDAAKASEMFDSAHKLGDQVDSSMRGSLLEKIDSARRGI